MTPWDDRAVTVATMTELTSRAIDALAPERRASELPNPLITTEKLANNLQLATNTNTEISAVVAASSRAALFNPTADRQAAVGEALIHCLHQLDHRSQVQDQRIIDLESQLAEASRRILALESHVTVDR